MTRELALNRLVRLAHSLLKGSTLDVDEALTLSGAAFRHYLFDAAINHAWRACYPGVELRTQSWEVDNYGALEALSGQSGVHFPRYERLRVGELIGLAEHDLRADRHPWILLQEGHTSAWRSVSSLDKSSGQVELTLDATAPTATTLRWTLRSNDDLLAPEARVLRVLVARGEPRGASPSLRHNLQREVLRFAASHTTRPKELRAEDELFYATGSAAYEHLGKLARGDVPAPQHDAPPAQDALPMTAPGLTLDGFDRFAEDHVRELHEARSAAARTLLRWQEDDTLWRPQEAQALHNASTAYQHTCQALDVALSASPGSPAHLDALSQAAEADRAAAAALHTFEG